VTLSSRNIPAYRGPRGGTCTQPYVKGLVTMINSIYNGYRMEDVWLDK
jgi:peptide/nickel transport system substrate-binding protein